MSVHGGEWVERDGYPRCKQCGSISPAEAARRLTTPGCKFSGTDKGGYKFYIEDEKGEFGKFYGEHLADLTEESLEIWAKISRKVLGVGWTFQKNAPPKYVMPKLGTFYGWQTSGRIGDDGETVFDKASPIPPPEEWWERQREKHNP